MREARRGRHSQPKLIFVCFDSQRKNDWGGKVRTDTTRHPHLYSSGLPGHQVWGGGVSDGFASLSIVMIRGVKPLSSDMYGASGGSFKLRWKRVIGTRGRG